MYTCINRFTRTSKSNNVYSILGVHNAAAAAGNDDYDWVSVLEVCGVLRAILSLKGHLHDSGKNASLYGFSY